MADDRSIPAASDATLRAMTACGAACWQLPLILFTSWWNAATAGVAWPHPRSHHPDGHQLIVPDPIEVEGEHALFA